MASRMLCVGFMLLLQASLNTGFAQHVAINNNNAPPHPGAILDISADSAAVLLPRTDTSAIPNRVRGFIIYDTLLAGFYQCNGDKWLRLLDESAFSYYFADRDGDGYGDKFSAMYALHAIPGYVPDSLDCDDANPGLSPGQSEICDGIDNDCDPSSPDGMDEPAIGLPCDGQDTDFCEEGIWSCAGGALACTDLTTNTVEICDSLDNDCDGMIDEGCTNVTIGWGNVQWPASTTTTVNVATELIFGQVYAAGVTDAPGQGMGIIAQLGFGPDGSDPALGGWTWVYTMYNTDHLNNDEYMASLTPNVAGTFDYAYRYSGDDGVTWLYGDFGTGSSNGYAVSDAGDLTVNPE